MLILIVFCLIICGCGKKNYFNCRIDIDNTINGYKLTGIYKIKYKGSFVTYIEKNETYLANKKEVATYFKESKDLEYSNLRKNYGGVEYELKSSEKAVSISAKINLKELDIKKLSNDGLINKDYVTANKISINGIKHIYEEKGAVCDEL